MCIEKEQGQKIDIMVKSIIRDKEGLFIIINTSIQQEGTVVLNLCVSNSIALKNIIRNWQNFKKNWCIHIIMGNDNIPLSVIDRLWRQRNQLRYKKLEH